MPTLTAKTYDGRTYSDESWTPEALTAYVSSLIERADSPELLVLDVEFEEVVLLPFRDVAELRVSGIGHTDEWV